MSPISYDQTLLCSVARGLQAHHPKYEERRRRRVDKAALAAGFYAGRANAAGSALPPLFEAGVVESAARAEGVEFVQARTEISPRASTHGDATCLPNCLNSQASSCSDSPRQWLPARALLSRATNDGPH